MKKNIAIITPLALNSVPVEFFQSFVQAQTYLQLKSDELPFEVGQLRWIAPHTFPIDANRNECVAWLKKWDIDISVWIDADQVLEMDTLFKLLKKGDGYPIYAGIYHLKKPPYHPIVFTANDDFDVFYPVYFYPEEDPFYADMLGMGCVKIDMEVFNELDRPYFKYQPIPKEISEIDELYKFKFDNEVNDVSEDVWFWKQVRENTDFRVVVDPTIQVGHITGLSINKANYLGYQAYKKELTLKQVGQKKFDEIYNKAKRPELVKPNKKARFVL